MNYYHNNAIGIIIYTMCISNPAHSISYCTMRIIIFYINFVGLQEHLAYFLLYWLFVEVLRYYVITVYDEDAISIIKTW